MTRLRTVTEVVRALCLNLSEPVVAVYLSLSLKMGAMIRNFIGPQAQFASQDLTHCCSKACIHSKAQPKTNAIPMLSQTPHITSYRKHLNSPISVPPLLPGLQFFHYTLKLETNPGNHVHSILINLLVPLPQKNNIASTP